MELSYFLKQGNPVDMNSPEIKNLENYFTQNLLPKIDESQERKIQAQRNAYDIIIS